MGSSRTFFSHPSVFPLKFKTLDWGLERWLQHRSLFQRTQFPAPTRGLTTIGDPSAEESDTFWLPSAGATEAHRLNLWWQNTLSHTKSIKRNQLPPGCRLRAFPAGGRKTECQRVREFSVRLGLLGMSEVVPIESHQDNCQDELNKGSSSKYARVCGRGVHRPKLHTRSKGN